MLLFAVLVSSAAGWSSEGHQIVSYITYELLSSTGRKYWHSHLGDTEAEWLAASSWADSDIAEKRYPDSADYHFSHTPYRKCQPFEFKRDCGFNRSGRCLVSGISGFVEYILDPEVARELRIDAFRFIVHFLGDIHQPLHTGFAKDAGGVKIPLIEPEMSLHDLWDYELINNLKVSVTKNPAGTWDTVAEYIVSRLLMNPSFQDQINAPVQDIETFLETDGGKLEYASILASETSMESTCTHAYRDTTNIYIEANTTITPVYIENRGKIVLRQLTKAGVRLAHLVNVVAELYYERKEEIRLSAYAKAAEKKLLTAVTSAPKIVFYNSFGALALDMDFEPEELCQEGGDLVSTSAVSSPTTASVVSPREPKKKKNKSSGRRVVPVASKTDTPTDEVTVLQPLATGLDLSRVTIIKRHGAYIVTSRDLVTPDYEPLFFDTFRIRFTKNVSPEPVTLRFDAAMFGKRFVSHKTVIRTILYLKGISVTDDDLEESRTEAGAGAAGSAAIEGSTALTLTSSSDIVAVENGGYIIPAFSHMHASEDKSGYWGLVAVRGGVRDDRSRRQIHLQSLINKRRNMRLKAAHRERYLSQLSMVGPDKEFKTLEKKWDYEFYSKLNKIVVYLAGHIQAFIHIDTLRNSSLGATHMRFSEHNGVYEGGNFFMLVDTAIYDGDITARIKRGMEIVGSKNMQLAKDYKFVRPTLIKELFEIDMLFFDSDPNRATRLRYVQNFFSYPGDEDESYFVFEWDLEPDSIRVIPF
jgi:hypothetical protein